MNQEVSEKHAITMLECMLYVVNNRGYDELNITEPEKAVYEAMHDFSANTIREWKEQRNRVAELKSVI